MGDRPIRIEQLAYELGITTRSVRRLEAKGVLPAAKRDRNNYRYYLPDDVRRLKAILYPPTEQAS